MAVAGIMRPFSASEPKHGREGSALGEAMPILINQRHREDTFLPRRGRGERHVPRVNGAVLAPSKAAHLHAFNRRLASLILSDARTLDTVSLPIGHIYSLDPRKIRNFMTQRLGFKVVGRHTLIKSGCHLHGTPG